MINAAVFAREVDGHSRRHGQVGETLCAAREDVVGEFGQQFEHRLAPNGKRHQHNQHGSNARMPSCIGESRNGLGEGATGPAPAFLVSYLADHQQ